MFKYVNIEEMIEEEYANWCNINEKRIRPSIKACSEISGQTCFKAEITLSVSKFLPFFNVTLIQCIIHLCF